MLDVGNALDAVDKSRVGDDGETFGRRAHVGVENLDVGAEAHNLVGQFALEAQQHAHRNNHHGQSDGDTHRGNVDGQLRDVAVRMFVEVKAAGDEERQIHLFRSCD